MAAFEREFHVQNLIKLEQNYRSHGHILDTANVLITNNRNRLGKNLRTDAGHGEPVRVYEASSDIQEANCRVYISCWSRSNRRLRWCCSPICQKSFTKPTSAWKTWSPCQ